MVVMDDVSQQFFAGYLVLSDYSDHLSRLERLTHAHAVRLVALDRCRHTRFITSNIQIWEGHR